MNFMLKGKYPMPQKPYFFLCSICLLSG